MVGRYASREEIAEAANALLGKTAADISGNIENRTRRSRTRSKAAMSHLIETDYFGIKDNSRSEPDFVDAGIELKVTPLAVTGKGALLRQKERLKIGSVNYHETYEAVRWSDVDLLQHKLNDVLIIWYIHLEDTPRSEFPVVWWSFWSPSTEQEEQMQRDFERTWRVIAEGEELTTRMCEFLGTFSDNAGGFNKQDPLASDPKSFTRSHPTREVAQIRGWCIKQGQTGMLKVIEDATGLERMSRNGATGISRTRFEKLTKKHASGDIADFRTQRTLSDF